MNILKNNLHHLAIIMDGNARWAKEKGVLKIEGHKKGANNIHELLEMTIEIGIPYLTIYCFSSENWSRSKEEVGYLLNLFSSFLGNQIEALNKRSIKLKIIGNLTPVSARLQKQIIDAQYATKDNSKLTLYIAFSYGGRQEIVDACQKLIDDKVDKLDVNLFKNYLYDPNMPDVDLLIRTADTYRISNFLLWQIAYAELYFCKKYWPDFNKYDLIEAVNDYYKRSRNFGTRT